MYNLNREEYLKTIQVSAGNKTYASYDGCLYTKDLTKMLCFPMGKSVCNIPAETIEIEDMAISDMAYYLEEFNVDKNNTVFCLKMVFYITNYK